MYEACEEGKPINLSAEGQQLIERQFEAFRKKFGRYPGPEDPVFFDPDEEKPVPLSDEEYERAVLAGMPQAGLDPAVIYAFKRTDRMVTDSNKHLLSKRELRQWNDAIDEYYRTVEPGELK
jgi:hypothetical protein